MRQRVTNICFQLDGASAHTIKLQNDSAFMISHVCWPSHSLDLTAPDLLLWKCEKTKHMWLAPNATKNWKSALQGNRTNNDALLQHIMQNFIPLQQCIKCHRGHPEHVIFKQESNVIYSFLGNSPMKMEPRVSSETSAIRTQTPGNYPKRNKLHLEHGESLKTRKRVMDCKLQSVCYLSLDLSHKLRANHHILMTLSLLVNTYNQFIIHRLYSNKGKMIGKYEELELSNHQLIRNWNTARV